VRGVDVTYDAKGNVIGAKNASVQKQIADLQEQREKVQKNLDDSLDTTAPMSESYGSDSDGARVDAMTKLLEQIDTKLAQIAGNTANQKPFRFSPIYGDRPEYVTTDGSGGNDSRNRPQTDRAGAK
jgi:septation ring formation regulator EzrA